jgi:putative spermidine/putrescine transport system permease protein
MTKLVRWTAITTLFIAVFAPIVPQLIWSLAFRWFFPDVLPSEWGLQAWGYVFSDSSRVGEALWNSIAVGVVTSLLAVLVGLPAARALGLYQFRGKALVEWLLLLPIIVPGIVVAMGIHVMFIRYRLTDNFWGVVLVHLIPTVPYMVLVMAGVFANYGTDLEDTARTLGARPLRVFWHVTLPAIWPGLAVAVLFTFLISWGQYVTTLLIGGGQVVTLPLVLFPAIQGANNATAAAISLVFVLPALIALALTARSLDTDAAVMGGFGKL